jgi:hypothetical protein
MTIANCGLFPAARPRRITRETLSFRSAWRGQVRGLIIILILILILIVILIIGVVIIALIADV